MSFVGSQISYSLCPEKNTSQRWDNVRFSRIEKCSLIVCVCAQSLHPRAFLDCELPGGRQVLWLFECPLWLLHSGSPVYWRSFVQFVKETTDTFTKFKSVSYLTPRWKVCQVSSNSPKLAKPFLSVRTLYSSLLVHLKRGIIKAVFFFWSITFLLYMLMIAHHTGNYFKVNLFLKIVFVVDSFAATFFSHLTTSTSYSRWLKCLLSSHHMTNCGQPPTSSGQSERSPAFWKLTSQTLGLFSLNWTNPLCWKPSHVWEKGIRFWDITSFEGSTEGKNDYF